MPFEPGRSGNPAGGPVGSRHRQQLNSEFIAALLRDFRHGGPKAIERVRRAQPASYMKILALLVPREHKVEQMNTFEGLSTEQIEGYIAAIQDRLDRRAAGHQVIDGEAAESRAVATTTPLQLEPPECRSNRLMMEADTAIGPRERKPKKRKVPSSSSSSSSSDADVAP